MSTWNCPGRSARRGAPTRSRRGRPPKAIDRVDRDGGLLRASDVLVVVEIVSPGSRRLDHVVKRHEYADAGIGHYWIADLDEPVTLLDCHLAGPLGYADGGSISGTFTTTTPCPIRLELDRLLR